MSLNSTDLSNISSLSSDFLDAQSKDLGDVDSVSVGDIEDELDLTNDVTATTLDASEKRDVLSPEDIVTAEVDASGFEDDYLDFTDESDESADDENTENTERSRKSSSNVSGNGGAWIDAESVTDSLQNLNDHGSILSHFQHLYQVESTKSRQKRRAQVRSSNQQIRSFSLSPKHKMNRSKLMRMKQQRSKENSRSNKENKDSNEETEATVIRDHDGSQLFSAERVHERRSMKRKVSEDKIRAEKVTECTFSPEIDVKSASLMHEKRGNKSFFDVVEEDIEERKFKADARQRESEANLMKEATFTPKINRDLKHAASTDYYANADVFQRLSSQTGSPLVLKTQQNESRPRSKSKPGNGRNARDRIYNKKRHSKGGHHSAAMFASPRRIQEMSDRLYRNHAEIELKKQVLKKSIEREEAQQRASSKVLAHSRRIIVKAFLSKFKQVILGKEPRDIDNMTCFSYDEIEMALTEIGYAQTTPKSATSVAAAASSVFSPPQPSGTTRPASKIQQLIALLDPEHTSSVRWGDMKRFFRRIAANKSDSKHNRELYQIMQFLYVNKLLKAKPEHGGAKLKAKSTAKWDAKKWEAEVGKQRRKQLLNKERKARQQRERRSKEMAECTFVPKINKSTAAMTTTTKSTFDAFEMERDEATSSLADVPRFEQLYEDAQDRKMRHNEKIIESELAHYAQYKAHSFRPKINHNSREAANEEQNEPQGFDEAVLRLSEGRIRSKQEEIRQQYEQKKMSLQWQKRAKWLRHNKTKSKKDDEVADATKSETAEPRANNSKTASEKKRKVKKHTILSATHKLTAKVDALADDDDGMEAV